MPGKKRIPSGASGRVPRHDFCTCKIVNCHKHISTPNANAMPRKSPIQLPRYRSVPNLTLKNDMKGTEKSQYVTPSISLFNPSTSAFLICSTNSFLTLFSNPSQLMLINLSIGSIRVVMSFKKEYTAAGDLHARIIFSLILMTERATRKTYAEPSTKKTSHTRKRASNHVSMFEQNQERKGRNGVPQREDSP